jgi:hypothetical protein
VFGIVTDGDDTSPIGGATVAALYSSFPSASTDGNGYFDLVASVASGAYPVNYLTITKPGYDRTDTWVSGNRDERRDFHLYRPLNISAGVSTQVGLSDDNSLCGLDDEFRCRTVYIGIPSNGTLVMDTAANDSTGLYWLMIGDPQYPFHGVTHLETPATAGSVVIVKVLRDWSAPSGFATLRTTLANEGQ